MAWEDSEAMASESTPARIYDEIRQIVADAIASRETLQVGPHARRLAGTYPGSGLSEGRIADEIIMAASRAGVPAMEIG